MDTVVTEVLRLWKEVRESLPPAGGVVSPSRRAQAERRPVSSGDYGS
jgi:hypothetical protein